MSDHRQQGGLANVKQAQDPPDSPEFSPERLAFFGTGAEAHAAFARLGEPKLTAVFDNDPARQGETVFACEVAAPGALDASIDRLVICSMFYARMAEQLADLGFPANRIWISYRGEFKPLAAINDHVQAVQRAEKTIASYMEDQLSEVPDFGPDRAGFLEKALALAPEHGLIMEFGVHEGTSLEILCSATVRTVFGFDSFRGLSENWTFGYQAGYFDKAGQEPEAPRNAELVVGYFEHTLHDFLAAHSEPVSFIHMDADLYSSNLTVLEALGSRLEPGVVIVFDEYLYANDPALSDFNAFRDWAGETGARWNYILRAQHRVALQII